MTSPNVFPDACPDPAGMLEEEVEKPKKKRAPRTVIDPSTVCNVIDVKDDDKKAASKKKASKKKPSLTKIIEDPKEDKDDE